jgi:hypothetical protein
MRGSAGAPAAMDREFIQEIETWGSGGHMMDVLILKDGRVLVLTESGIALYESRDAFDRGARSAAIDSASASPQSERVDISQSARRRNRA